MVVIAPGDAIEAEKATKAIAENGQPSYIRLAREKTPVFSLDESPFEIGKAYVLKEGTDVALMGTGTMTYQLLLAAKILAENGINAEVLHVPTIKPLDEETILATAKKTGRVITAEEAQIAGGFGSAIAELLSDKLPMPVKRFGVQDRFGESGDPKDIFKSIGLTGEQMVEDIKKWCAETPRYHQESPVATDKA
jgi:transketolase